MPAGSDVNQAGTLLRVALGATTLRLQRPVSPPSPLEAQPSHSVSLPASLHEAADGPCQMPVCPSCPHGGTPCLPCRANQSLARLSTARRQLLTAATCSAVLV